MDIRTPNKRKPDDVPKGRKAKKLKFDKLVGWGEGPSKQAIQTESEAEGSVKGTLGSHNVLGEGSRSGWKSSQGGASNKADGTRGVRDTDTLPDVWRMKLGRNERHTEGWKLADQDKTLPDGWKAEVVVDGVNTPTASLRNIIEGKTLHEVVDSKEPGMREGGVNTPTASLKRIPWMRW